MRGAIFRCGILSTVSASWSKSDREAAGFTQAQRFSCTLWGDLVVCSDLLTKPTTYHWTLLLLQKSMNDGNKKSCYVVYVVGSSSSRVFFNEAPRLPPTPSTEVFAAELLQPCLKDLFLLFFIFWRGNMSFLYSSFLFGRGLQPCTPCNVVKNEKWEITELWEEMTLQVNLLSSFLSGADTSAVHCACFFVCVWMCIPLCICLFVCKV